MNDWLPKAFSDFDGYVATLPEVQRNAVNESFRWSPNPDEDKKRLLGVAYAADKLGIDSEEVSQHFETDYMHRVALDPNGLGMVDPPRDVNEFFDAASKRVKRDGEIAVVANEAAQRAAVDALGADYLPSFSKWQAEAKAKPGYDSQADAEYKRAFDATQTKVAPYKQFINDSVNTLRANMSEDGTQWKDFDFKAAADHILAIPAGDRPFVLDAIGSLGAQKEDKRAFMDKIALAFDRGAADLGAKVGGTGQDIWTAAGIVGQDLPTDQAVAAAKAVDARGEQWRNRRVVAQQIRDIATGKISPLTSGNIIGRGLIGASESLPITAAAFVPYTGPAALVAYFKEDSYLNLRANSPELSDAQAQAISTISAPIQAVTEVISDRLLANRLPSLHRALNSPVLSASGIAARFVGQAALGTATEFAEEKIQNATDPVLQKIGHALSEDMPDVANWNQYMDRFKGGNLDLIAQILPLSLIGAGGATFESVAYSKALGSSSLLLEAAGYQKTDAAKIADAVKSGDTKTAEALMRHGWREIAAGKEAGTVEDVTTEAAQKVMADFRELEAKEQALKDAAFSHLEEVGATLPLRKTVEGWTLTMEDGSAATFATHQEADEARWSHLAETYSIQPAEQIREFIGQAEQAAATGREFVYEFDPKQMTTERAVAEGITTLEAIGRRAQQAQALTDDQSYDVARATAATQGTEQAEVSGVILGSNKDEFKSGVLRSTMRLYQGATPITIVEEALETAGRRLVKTKREWLETALREWENVSGDKLFRDTDKLEDSDLLEAFSHFGQSYFLARSKKHGADTLPSWKDSSFRQSMRKLMGAKLSSAMDAFAVFFRSVFKRAAKIAKARRDGVLSQELEQEIASSLGFTDSYVHARETMQEARQLAHDASDEGLSYTPPSDAPFSFVPTKDTKETVLPDGARLVGPASFSFVAYHGTPHKVDKFRLDKIGTGEGAQAYGWGLYFAESRKVAEEYRKMVTSASATPRRSFLGDEVQPGTPEYRAASLLDEAGRTLAGVRKEVQGWIRDAKEGEDVAGYRATLDALNKLTSKRDVKRIDGGNLYTVELLPNADEFLDWDKPLSEQSEKVRAAIEQEFGKLAQMDMSGGDWHAWITRDDTDAKTLSGDLARIGIKGIRYLDGGSRNAGDGTRNYVIFDESLVRILEENGKPVESNFSFLPGELPAQLESMFDPFKSPEAKARVGMIAKNRVAKLGLEWEQVAKQQKKVREIEAQRKEMQARLEDENLAKLTPETHAAFNTPEEQAKAVENPVVAMLVKRDAATKRYRGRLMSYSAAMAKGLDVADQYDDRIALPAWMYGGTLTPDQAAKELHDENLINGSHASDLWSALDSAFTGAQKTREGIEKAKAAMREAKSSAKAEADAWAAGQRKEQEQRAKALDRGRLLQALRVLDAAISALPMEIRGKIGGYVKLASLDTDEARVDAIAGRVDKIEREMERWLSQQYRGLIQSALDKNKSKRSMGGQMTGRTVANVTEQVSYAAEFVDLSKEGQDKEIAHLESIIDDAKSTSEQIDIATNKLGLAELFYDFGGQGAESLEVAHKWLKETIQKGRDTKNVLDEERRNSINRLIVRGVTDVLGRPASSQIDAENVTEEIKGSTLRRVVENVKAFINSVLPTTAQQLEDVFGVESGVVVEFMPRIWSAANLSTDIKTSIEAKRKAMLARVFKTSSTIQQIKALTKLQQARRSGVVVQEGRKTEEVRVPVEILERLADGKISAKDAGLSIAEVKEALDQWASASVGTKGATIERVTNPGSANELTMSEMEGLNYLLHWNQDAVRARMESHGWSDASIAQLQSFLSDEAKEIGRWMSEAYLDAGRSLVDPVYRRLFRAPLPFVKNFAPTFYNIGGNDAAMTVDQSQNSSGMMASFTKGRKPHGRSVRRVDAMTAFLSHFEHVAHWVSFAELTRDMKAVLLSTEVQNAVITKYGPSASASLTRRIKSIETQGNNQAWSLHEIDGMFSRINQARAFKVLAFRISPIVKQTSAVFNPLLADIPAADYALGMGRLLGGKLDVSGMWKSDAIRRRIDGGFSAEARLAMQASANGPVGAVAIQLMQRGIMPMQYTDGGWTAVGAAIGFDYYRSRALAAGESPQMAGQTANKAVERMIAITAQPADLVNRSLIEGSPNPFVKAAWMFASESRKTLAIEYYAAKRLLTGRSKNKAMDFQRVAVAHFVMGAVTQLMSGLLALAFSDDDKREREWSADEWAAAILAGPINGLFVVGDGLNYMLRAALRLRVFKSLPGYVKTAEDAKEAATHVDALLSGDGEEILKEMDRLSAAIGSVSSAFVGPAAQAPDVLLGNPLREVAKILDKK